MYPNGSTYFGQHSQFVKNGMGKLIEINGNFLEGNWENDKLNGQNCRIYDNVSNECYSGAISDGMKNGVGVLYDPDLDQVYSGNFERNKRSGEGTIFKRNGQVKKGDFRNNTMEGHFENLPKLSKKEVEKVFSNAMRNLQVYISVNKNKE